MQIGFRWLSDLAEKDKSYFDPGDISAAETPRFIVHPVIWEGGKVDALCVVRSDGISVTLDYEAFAEENEALGLLCGQTRLTLDRNEPPSIIKVEWRDAGTTEFIAESFEALPPRRSRRKSEDEVNTALQTATKHARTLSNEELEKLLPATRNMPRKIAVSTEVYVRNPYVVVATLRRAKGICEDCGQQAPFIARATGEPFLEVHHIRKLSEGGSDSLDNTIALCPNCHRRRHYA